MVPLDADDPPTPRRAVAWLRLLKLLLSVVLLAIGVLEALGRLGLAGG
ncbi:MAG: hypothetical protein U5J98_00600 [Halobacteriales archaeon]|nr:hypothetical protein [Halobacteriales archaeon]